MGSPDSLQVSCDAPDLKTSPKQLGLKKAMALVKVPAMSDVYRSFILEDDAAAAAADDDDDDDDDVVVVVVVVVVVDVVVLDVDVACVHDVDDVDDV